jgi:hypothetical protein
LGGDRVFPDHYAIAIVFCGLAGRYEIESLSPTNNDIAAVWARRQLNCAAEQCSVPVNLASTVDQFPSFGEDDAGLCDIAEMCSDTRGDPWTTQH